MNELVKIPTPTFSMSDVEKIASAIAKSGMFGLKDPYGVLTLCLLAQAEGQHPAVVFRDYSVISGKPAKKAEAMLRDFINAGGKVEWHKLDDDGADATFSHPAGTARISWDKERAKKAGLGSTGMYDKYPRQMYRARVISEGIRTVYPGATSGLYVPDEVAAFTPGGDAAPPNPQTGEVIEGDAVVRQKIPGIQKIKDALRQLMIDGNKALDLETFDALVAKYQTELDTIRDGNHEFWTGDGGDSAGYKAWIDYRREELTPQAESLTFQLVMSTLETCETSAELQSWLGMHGDAVDGLDGEERRRFEAAYNSKEVEMLEKRAEVAGAK